MVFTSPVFLFFFLPITILLYFITFKINLKVSNVLLLVASLFFYSWGEPQYIFLMIASIIFNYIFGLGISSSKKKNAKRMMKIILVIAIVFNIGLLFYFKYFDFIISTSNQLFLMLSGQAPFELMDIALPIGISFFTFQAMSYVIDVYMGKTNVQKNLLYLSLYISFFPQLIAGPIVRYVDINEQILSRSITLTKIGFGIQRFVIGFFKKIVIANFMAILADKAFDAAPGSLSASMAWLGVLAYSLQIFFDFSAYSDMAIGLGKMTGFDFKENFNYPYISKSAKEFWRRWHISLSTWFRDYLYIPLGGNRKGVVRTYLNLLIVFFATGLWHGASFNFILWGLYWGAFLIIERIFLGNLLDKAPKILSWLYTILVMLIGWVFFRAIDLTTAIKYIGSMFNFANIGLSSTVSNLTPQLLFSLILGIVFCFPIYSRLQMKFGVGEIITAKPLVYILFYIGIIVLFYIAILYMVGNSGNDPFIYFRF